MTIHSLLKNPIFYYALAPILIGLWPILVWRVYLPRAQRSLNAERDQYVNAENCMLKTLNLDQGRIIDGGVANPPGKFTYQDAISRVADRCQIASRNYNYNAGNIVKTGGKEIQGAKVTLTDVGIIQSCRFLSTIQSTWVNLECESAKLTKKEGLPDSWDVDFSFKYTY